MKFTPNPTTFKLFFKNELLLLDTWIGELHSLPVPCTYAN
jgi:hypothetical protein